MPSTPMFLSASLTSSSFVRLNDRFNFFHVRLRFQVIAFFAMHADVQPFDFLLLLTRTPTTRSTIFRMIRVPTIARTHEIATPIA